VLLQLASGDVVELVHPAPDGGGEFGERRHDAQPTVSVEAEFVVAAANVLHEGVSSDDHVGWSIGP
jgi:hypothetical protein